MSQDQWIIFLFRVVVAVDVASILAFIAIYWYLAPWWKNPIGRTIVIKDILLILILAPSVLSLFFRFNRLTSHIAAWIDIALFALLAVVMVWRSVVWVKLHDQRRKRKQDTDEQQSA